MPLEFFACPAFSTLPLDPHLARANLVTPRGPSQMAAHDAAVHDWPAAAVRLVTSAVVVRYREEATHMLAEPMATALAFKHSNVADVIWEALIQGRPEPQRLVCRVAQGAGHLICSRLSSIVWGTAVCPFCEFQILVMLPAANACHGADQQRSWVTLLVVCRYTDLIVQLAAAGDYARALWIADAAPPVMVQVGSTPQEARGLCCCYASPAADPFSRCWCLHLLRSLPAAFIHVFFLSYACCLILPMRSTTSAALSTPTPSLFHRQVGTAPAAAAAERGHEKLAMLMAERAGRPLPGGRAAAARGRLTLAVEASDTSEVESMLSEITLGPGDLRRDLVRHAAEVGDLEMLLLLLERLGPWMGEEVECISALVQNGHWQLVERLHARSGGVLKSRLLRACLKLCGGLLEPHAGLMLWALRTTTNPAALDLTVRGARVADGAVTARVDAVRTRPPHKDCAFGYVVLCAG